MVCLMIHDAGLSDFYGRENYQPSGAPPPEIADALSEYDLADVQGTFVTILNNGCKEATLLIEGIHCAACVWLIEKVMHQIKGVVKAEVNLAHHRLLLRWDGDAVPLSTLLQRLAQMGYAAVPFNEEAAEGQYKRKNRALLFRMAFAGFGAMNIMWISIALYAGAFSGIDLAHKYFFQWVSFWIGTAVLLYSGSPFFTAAWAGVKRGYLTMDLPIALGALMTWSYSTWIAWYGLGEVYFDTLVTFLFVILIGRYLEGASKRNAASAAMKLMQLQPRMANRMLQNGAVERVSVQALQRGDLLRITPGDKIPADGVIVDGHGHVDESMLSGESLPLAKGSGASVVAGSVNGDGAFTMRVEGVGSETALANIVALVEAAQGSRAEVQQLADRIVPWFVAVTLLLALITFLYWFSVDLHTAVLAAVSVLIITCPCALGLATPMGIAAAVGVGAKHGVLVRHGHALERMSKVSHVVFDKTGTLTVGKMEITSVWSRDGEVDMLLQKCAAVEQFSSHPIAKAVMKATRQWPLIAAEGFAMDVGYGVSAMVKDRRIAIGSHAFMVHLACELPDAGLQWLQEVASKPGMVVWVAEDDQVMGIIHLRDQLREDARPLLQQLIVEGVRVTMLTGDTALAAEGLRDALGVEMSIVAGVHPDEKLRYIQQLQDCGEVVLMIGDGVNDAPALAASDVSMAMGSGMDVSMACADMILVGSRLSRVAWAMALSTIAMRTIRHNLMFSLGYNVILLPMAMAALITPVFAAIAMPISSLLVIGNAVWIRQRMRHVKG